MYRSVNVVTRLNPFIRRPLLSRRLICHTPSPRPLNTSAPDPSSRKSKDLDTLILQLARSARTNSIGLGRPDLYPQYRQNADLVLPLVLPYEAYPSVDRGAGRLPPHQDPHNGLEQEEQGDGIVLVVHVSGQERGVEPDVSVCSGFIIRAEDQPEGQELVVSCAHALEEIHHKSTRTIPPTPYTSFILTSTSTSTPFPITSILSSSPRSDLLVMSMDRDPTSPPLRSLPVSPYPMEVGHGVLCHTFGSPEVPGIKGARGKIDESGRSVSAVGGAVRAESSEHTIERDKLEESIPWIDGHAYRRWASGTSLGYRSHHGREVQPGTSDRLPHILTSILPTPGSSGGPIVDAETGAVVGVISGRRMDNRVEGERGWGASAEGIFEMFSLPGFVPASRKKDRP